MADTKISALTELDGSAGNIPIAGDLIPCVDTSAVQTKSIDLLKLTHNIFNVTSYGATGDGVTDDTSAIQAAIDAVPATGGIVFFPGADGVSNVGVYLTTGLTYSGLGPVTFMGAGGGSQTTATKGSVIKLSATGIALTLGVSGTTIHSGCHVIDLSFDGGSNASSTGIKVIQRNSNYIEKCMFNAFDGASSIGIDLDPGTDATVMTTISTCQFRNAITGVDTTGAVTSTKIFNSYFAGCTTGVTGSSAGDTLMLFSSAFDGCTTGAVLPSFGSMSQGCRYENNTTALSITGSKTMAIGNYITMSGTQVGISISSSLTTVQLLGNTYYNTGSGKSVSWADITANVGSVYDGTGQGIFVPNVTAANLADSANAINTTDIKTKGTLVMDGTNYQLMVAAGANATDPWVNPLNRNKITPGTGAEYGLSEVVTSTNVITTSESGKTFLLNAGGGFVSTLPALTLGLEYTFIVRAAPSTGSYTIVTTSGTNDISGLVNVNNALVQSADQDTITFTQSAATRGDWVKVTCDGAKWYVSGQGYAATSIAFSAT